MVERVRPKDALEFGMYREDSAVEISDEVES